jgi:micrococcal nuclease
MVKTKAILIFALILLVGCSQLEDRLIDEALNEIQRQQPSETIETKVVSVSDGDTIKVSINGETKTIRMIGIDTPETVDPRKPVQCYGPEASNNAKILLSNQTVVLENDLSQGDVDKYGRLLRYVYLVNNSISYNEFALQMGYAREYTYNTPYKYQLKFKQAEQSAINSKAGLWGACGG